MAPRSHDDAGHCALRAKQRLAIRPDRSPVRIRVCGLGLRPARIPARGSLGDAGVGIRPARAESKETPQLDHALVTISP